MTADLRVEIGRVATRFEFGDVSFVAPVGVTTLSLESDPPRPEELTNAIGEMADHVDDLLRDAPDVVGAPTSVAGPVAREIAAVEVGHEPELPMTLSRAAVEDVFRTVATERRADRARNPGLSASMVDEVVAGCCLAVGIMRRLQLDSIEVVG
jgi:exopolyphosphatase/pppGpp-phosphohydrolase